MTIKKFIDISLDEDSEHDVIVNVYWELPPWEQHVIDSIADHIPEFLDSNGNEGLRYDIATKIWAQLTRDNHIVSHIYAEDEVLF